MARKKREKYKRFIPDFKITDAEIYLKTELPEKPDITTDTFIDYFNDKFNQSVKDNWTQRYFKRQVSRINTNTLSVEYLASVWLSEKSVKSESTVRQYTSEINDFCGWLHYLDPPVEFITDFTGDMMVAYIERAGIGRNPGGRAASLRPIKAFLRWVDERDDIPATYKTPYKKIKNLRPPLPDVKIVSDEDVTALVKSFLVRSDYVGIRDRAFFFFLLYSGCRSDEILHLEWRNIDFLNNSAYIPKAKGGEGRTVIISQIAADALMELKTVETRKNNFVWLSSRSDSELKKSGLRGILRRKCSALGVEEITQHQFRRRYAIKLIESDAQQIAVQHLMGHKSERVLQSYVRFTHRNNKIVYDRHSSALDPILPAEDAATPPAEQKNNTSEESTDS